MAEAKEAENLVQSEGLRAEQAENLPQSEGLWAEKLAAKLRSLGIEPDKDYSSFGVSEVQIFRTLGNRQQRINKLYLTIRAKCCNFLFRNRRI